MLSTHSKPIIYLNRWEYGTHELVKIVIKNNTPELKENLKTQPWLRYSMDYRCYYFIRSEKNLHLCYDSFSEQSIINDRYLNKKPIEISHGKVVKKKQNSIGSSSKRDLEKIWLLPIKKGNEKLLFIKFKPYSAVYKSLKDYKLARWDKQHVGFVIDHNLDILKQFIIDFGNLVNIRLSKEIEYNNPGLIKLILDHQQGSEKVPIKVIDKLVSLNYSMSTVRSYHMNLCRFFNHYPDIDIDKIAHGEIVKYIDYLRDIGSSSPGYINQVINSIKFYYEKILGHEKKPVILTDLKKRCPYQKLSVKMK